MKRFFDKANIWLATFLFLGTGFLSQICVADTTFGHPASTQQISHCKYGVKTCASKTKYHSGVDYESSSTGNDIVVASNAGKVAKVVYNGSSDHGMGNTVILEHTLTNDKKIYSLYAHLASIDSGISTGKEVSKGARIGIMGGSGKGSSTYWGIHLHFEIKDEPVLNNPDGSYPYWGYMPSYPDNYGYYNPNDFIGKLSVKSTTLSYIQISGISSIKENSCQFYSVYAHYTDGNSANVTNKVYWGNYSWLTVSNSYGGSYAQVCASSVSSDSHTELNASYNEGDVYKSDQFDITIKDSSSSSVTTSQMVEYVFDKLEDNYSDYFSPHQQTFSYDNNYYRSYPNGSWLYLYQGTVWYNLYGYGWNDSKSSIKQWYDSFR